MSAGIKGVYHHHHHFYLNVRVLWSGGFTEERKSALGKEAASDRPVDLTIWKYNKMLGICDGGSCHIPGAFKLPTNIS